MEDYILNATHKTPRLCFEYGSGQFEISGRSIPENSTEFYQPLLDWLDKYAFNPKNEALLTVKLEYFNTSSSKCLVEVFRRLEKIHKSGKTIQVEWFYEEEDEDMLESGEDFKEVLKLPIKLILIKGRF